MLLIFLDLYVRPEDAVRQIQRLAHPKICVTSIAKPQFLPLFTFSNINFAKPPLVCFYWGLIH